MFGEEGIFLWWTAGAYMYPHEQLKGGVGGGRQGGTRNG